MAANINFEKLRYKYIPDHILGEILSKNWIDNAIPFLVLVVTIVTFGIVMPNFFSAGNIGVMVRELGEFGLICLGMMIVVIGGGIDLSLGSNFALANFLTLFLLNITKLPLPVTIVTVILASGTVGLLNGLLIGYLRLRAFLTTLVSLIIIRAIVNILLLVYAQPVASGTYDSNFWDFIGSGNIAFLPFSFAIFVVIAIIMHIMLSRTRPGWRIMAIGGSRRSAHNIGIGVRRTVCSTYVISGMLCGLAGVLYAARLGGAGSDTGAGLEIEALTAVVLGGIGLGGGRGSVAKALMGTIVVLLVTNSVISLGLNAGSGSMILGLILIFAVFVDVKWFKHRDKLLAKVYVSPAYIELPPLLDTSAPNSPYLLNDRLRNVELLGLEQVEGPEDVILDQNDDLYCGTRQGDIMRFRAPDYAAPELFAHIGGHPLGMSFDQDNNLVTCIGGMGLYKVSQSGEVSKITDETNRSRFSILDDSRLRLADDLDIAPDGRIFFSEATVRYEMTSWPTDALEGRGNGRIVCYDPRTKKTKTVLRNLIFPNGVCLEYGGQSILFAESWACRINRYWFDGPKAGTLERVIEDLPGYPDNINRASDGNYWVAIMGMRTPVLDTALRMPGFRRRMARRVAADEWLYPNLNIGCVIKIDSQGNTLESLWDFGGLNHPMITSMREHKGYLYLGGITNNRIGRCKLDGADPHWVSAESYWSHTNA